jgi:hypothetical protein
MKSRVWDVPALYVARVRVPADHFNRVRLALLRVGNPLRLELKHLRTLDLLLGDAYWACVDRGMSDLPVIAWTHFQTASRRGLHEPVECQVRHYHVDAGVILQTLFTDMAEVLDQRLAAGRSAGSRRIISLPGSRQD